jgi:hypothetical protein
MAMWKVALPKTSDNYFFEPAWATLSRPPMEVLSLSGRSYHLDIDNPSFGLYSLSKTPSRHAATRFSPHPPRDRSHDESIPALPDRCRFGFDIGLEANLP